MSLNAKTARRSASEGLDRKSTRLNSSHLVISYAVFCLKKKRDGRVRSRGDATRAPVLDARARDPVEVGLRCVHHHRQVFFFITCRAPRSPSILPPPASLPA